MAFAIVHFTAGFVIALLAASVGPADRFRLTWAFLGGIWALVPDVHHLLGGETAARIYALHNDPAANLFFFHHVLDRPVFRQHNTEITFVALAVLGLALLGYELRFAPNGRSRQSFPSREGVEDSQ